MKKWLLRLIWIPALALTVLFLVANRRPVAVSLDPVNAAEPALTTPAFPLWMWLMAMLFFGIAAGALGMWLSARPKRIEARADRRAVKDLRKQVTSLETQLREARSHDAASVPAVAEPPFLESEDA
ncbi:MAG: LapA family protein [Pseudomonadota bacterium]